MRKEGMNNSIYLLVCLWLGNRIILLPFFYIYLSSKMRSVLVLLEIV